MRSFAAPFREALQGLFRFGALNLPRGPLANIFEQGDGLWSADAFDREA
jgi:hypothetical protein